MNSITLRAETNAHKIKYDSIECKSTSLSPYPFWRITKECLMRPLRVETIFAFAYSSLAEQHESTTLGQES